MPHYIHTGPRFLQSMLVLAVFEMRFARESALVLIVAALSLGSINASCQSIGETSVSSRKISTPRAGHPNGQLGSVRMDSFGGTTSVQCRKGSAPHFYTEKIGNRWWLCDPSGNGFFIRGVWDMEPNVNNSTASFIQSKYAGPLSDWKANWALEQVRRLQSWGFNTVADYAHTALWPGSVDPAWDTTGNTIPIKMPFAMTEQTTHYAFVNSGGECGASALKDMMNGTGAAYTGYHYGFGDYFDPNFSTCVGTLLKNDTYGLQLALNSIDSPYLIYLTIDESDQTGFLDAGPDFTTVDNANTGVLAASYNAANVAWITLVTAPTQASNSSQGVTYSDQTSYTKLAFANLLANEYICTGAGTPISACTGNHTGNGSIDPSSSSYFGSTNLANGLNALNTAWNSYYTAWVSDTTHCGSNLATCLSGGTLSDFGTGDGLLEENGTCPSKGAHNCWMGDPYTLGSSSAFPTAETAAMRADMSAFYVYYLDQYFNVETTQFHTYAPGVMLQAELGSWGAPPPREVLTEAAKYIDLPVMGMTPAVVCLNCTDQQARIDFTAQYLGDRPWINWSGFYALPDSAESAYAPANPAYATQAERGAGYQTMVNMFLNAQTTAYGSYPIVGFDWWGLYDMNSQQANWGLLTPLDNPYDGVSATIKGAGPDQWGYPTGRERGNYGDFLSAVSAANHRMLSQMAGLSGLVVRSAGRTPARP
jgi:hypothetical protein